MSCWISSSRASTASSLDFTPKTLNGMSAKARPSKIAIKKIVECRPVLFARVLVHGSREIGVDRPDQRIKPVPFIGRVGFHWFQHHSAPLAPYAHLRAIEPERLGQTHGLRPAGPKDFRRFHDRGSFGIYQ
jgi:hypothetical protein